MKKFFKEEMKASMKVMTLLVMILLYWEVVLYYQLHSTLRGIALYNVLFLLPIGAMLAALTCWSDKHERANEVFMIVLLLAVSVFYLGDLIYYKTFGSLVSVSMLGAGEDAVTNFWWSMKTTLKENALVILLFEAPVLLEIFLALKNKKRKDGFSVPAHLFTAFLAVGLWALVVLSLPLAGKSDYSAYGAYHSRYVDTDTASKKLGVLPNFLVELRYSFFGGNDPKEVLAEASVVELKEEEKKEEVRIEFNKLEGLDFHALAKDCEDEDIKDLLSYMGSQAATVRNDYTGLFKGYNLIYICAESFSSLAVDETVTPTLYKMANNGIVLKNFYNSFRNTTTNGEYAILTGVWPDVARQATNMGKITGTMGRSIGKDMTPSLGNTFALSEGLQPRAYHNYLGDYYGRNRTLPNMGFDCQFMNDGMKFTTAWPASDLEMMEQSVDDYIDDERFLTYYMTFSGHGNYTTNNVMVAKNIKTVTSKLSEHLPTSAEGYLAANYELEEAMAYLLQRLEEAGKLENTVIVLAGDHYPYYLTDAGYEALKGEAVDEDFESFHSSCIIYNAGLKEKIEVDTPCCNVDIIPTVYNLFGVAYDSRLYAGTDIFGNGMHIAQLYNKNFITDKVKYNAATGEAEWLIDTEEYSEDLLANYLDNAVNTVKNRYAFSIGIEDTDLYDYVFDHYDLNETCSEEEISEEDIEEVSETQDTEEVLRAEKDQLEE
ncbi:MAG: sulfatase-like hydrolase/transferase [Erysipelotrichaceae bacterium]|nr:sulfatase-like hydrolase/transferase [Erysipelotrichaceae bacterium]